MKLKSVFLFGLLMLTEASYAQMDFRPGYVIKAAGDTIVGQIDYRGDFFMSSLCTFKDADNEVMRYYPGDIEAFRFIDSKFFVTKEAKNKKVFMEYLIKGQVSIYYMRDENGDHYYLDKEDVELTEIPYEEEIKYIGKKNMLYKSQKHMGLLYYYMQDAPDLQSRIRSVKKPEHQNLIKLAEDYHNAVCEGEKCVIYEKKQSPIKVNLETLAGVVSFRNTEGVQEKYYFQSGVIANLWLPRTNEKVYFRAGFLYSQPEQNGGRRNRTQVLTHIGYLASDTYRIRPSLSIGLLSPSYSGGVLFKINERINIGVQSFVNFDFNNVPWVPARLFSYSFLGNLHIEF